MLTTYTLTASHVSFLLPARVQSPVDVAAIEVLGLESLIRLQTVGRLVEVVKITQSLPPRGSRIYL
jgi:hypothetical protein